MAMNPRTGTASHPRDIENGPKHSHAMTRNAAPNPSGCSQCAHPVHRSVRDACRVRPGAANIVRSATSTAVWHITVLSCRSPYYHPAPRHQCAHQSKQMNFAAGVNCAPARISSAGFLLLLGSLGAWLILVGFVRIAVRAVLGARNLVVVEIAHQLSGAPFFHDPFKTPPRGLRSLRGTAPLRIDVAHDVIHVDILAAGCGVLGVLFLELFRFGFLVHALKRLVDSHARVINGNAAAVQYPTSQLTIGPTI